MKLNCQRFNFPLVLCFLTVLFGGKRCHDSTKNVGGKRSENGSLRRNDATKMTSGGKETTAILSSVQSQTSLHFSCCFCCHSRARFFILSPFLSASKPEMWRNVQSYEEMCLVGWECRVNRVFDEKKRRCMSSSE